MQQRVEALAEARSPGRRVADLRRAGDAAAWGPRLGQGFVALLNSALKGKGAMGPQGGGDFSDFEIARAVVYMANKAGGTFPEPKPPAAGQATTATSGEAGAAPAPATAPGTAPPVGGIAPTATGSSAAPVLVAAAAAATPGEAAPATTPAPTAAAGAGAGAMPALYTQACQVCHGAGIAGAPKLGDKAAWAPRLAQGIDGLTASAIKGKGAMPPRGGSTASDADIKAVVTYMVGSVK